MFVPYLADVVMKRWPIANWVLMGVTVVVSVAMLPALAEWGQEATITIARHGSHEVLEVSAAEGALRFFLLQPDHFNIFQLVGSLFIHEGIFHLLGNMLFLWVFGNAINAKLGHFWFIAFYLGAGVFEGTIYALFSHMPCLGASGAIMAVVGAFLVLYPRNDIRVFWTFWIKFGAGTLSAMWLIAIYLAFDIWGLVMQHSAVAYVAHVAGAAFGIGLMMVLLKKGLVESERDEENLLHIWGWQEMTDAQKEAFGLKPWKDPYATATPANIGAARPLPPRGPAKKRDEGPISLD